MAFPGRGERCLPVHKGSCQFRPLELHQKSSGSHADLLLLFLSLLGSLCLSSQLCSSAKPSLPCSLSSSFSGSSAAAAGALLSAAPAAQTGPPGKQLRVQPASGAAVISLSLYLLFKSAVGLSCECLQIKLL